MALEQAATVTAPQQTKQREGEAMTNDVAIETAGAKKEVFRRLVDIYARAAVDELPAFVAPD